MNMQLMPCTVDPSPPPKTQRVINIAEYLRVEIHVDDYDFFRDR
jgi:hypothetical protein